MKVKGNEKLGERNNLHYGIYYVLSSGRVFPKYNDIFRVDTIKVVSLIQHIQENIHLTDGCLSNVTIYGNKFKLCLCMNVAASVYEVCLNNIRIH